MQLRDLHMLSSHRGPSIALDEGAKRDSTPEAMGNATTD